MFDKWAAAVFQGMQIVSTRSQATINSICHRSRSSYCSFINPTTTNLCNATGFISDGLLLYQPLSASFSRSVSLY